MNLRKIIARAAALTAAGVAEEWVRRNVTGPAGVFAGMIAGIIVFTLVQQWLNEGLEGGDFGIA